jgi:hypothetical protein
MRRSVVERTRMHNFPYVTHPSILHLGHQITLSTHWSESGTRPHSSHFSILCVPRALCEPHQHGAACSRDAFERRPVRSPAKPLEGGPTARPCPWAWSDVCGACDRRYHSLPIPLALTQDHQVSPSCGSMALGRPPSLSSATSLIERRRAISATVDLGMPLSPDTAGSYTGQHQVSPSCTAYKSHQTDHD